MSILDTVAVVEETPLFTPYGYVITHDGMIYSLIQKWCHGVVLALIFPELAKQHGYEPPTEDFNVFTYQRFELDHSRETTAIRISIGVTNGQLNISKDENKKATAKQRHALSLIFKAQGLSVNDKVQSDLNETTVRTLLKQLESGEL